MKWCEVLLVNNLSQEIIYLADVSIVCSNRFQGEMTLHWMDSVFIGFVKIKVHAASELDLGCARVVVCPARMYVYVWRSSSLLS